MGYTDGMAEMLRIVYNIHMKQTVNAIGGILRDTTQKTIGEPFTLPIRLIEGQRGAAKEIVQGAGASMVALPFKLTGEVLKGMLRGGRDLATLALHLPWIPSWQAERQNVTRATQQQLDALLDAREERYEMAA
jgi:hypothetical protein